MGNETNEVEALAKVAVDAWDKSSEPLESARLAEVAEAVARAVRAQDAARAGTLTAEEIARLWDNANSPVRGDDDWKRMLRDALAHSAAQGRANAALMKERDAARSELAAKAAVALQWETDAKRAESALATLREAVEWCMERVECHATIRQKLSDALNATPAEAPDTNPTIAELEAILQSPPGTYRVEVQPNGEIRAVKCIREHTDTSMVPKWASDIRAEAELCGLSAGDLLTHALRYRAIRERSKDEEALGAAAACLTAEGWSELSEADKRAARASGRAGAAYLLGASGPSGGGEIEHIHGDGSRCFPGCPNQPSGDEKTQIPAWRSGYDPTPGAYDEFTPPPSGGGETNEADGPRDGEGAGAYLCRTVFGVPESTLARWNAEAKPTPPDVAASEPTPEEDWRTVEEALGHSGWCKCTPCGCGADAALSALARHKAEPRRAAEAMRERCAAEVYDDLGESRARILALPL